MTLIETLGKQAKVASRDLTKLSTVEKATKKPHLGETFVTLKEPCIDQGH